MIFIILVCCEGSGGFRVGSGWFLVGSGWFRQVPVGSGWVPRFTYTLDCVFLTNNDNDDHKAVYRGLS